MKKALSHILKKPYVLLVTAVLLYLLSFLFASEYSQRSGVIREWNRLQAYLENSRQWFYQLIADSSFTSEIIRRKESLKEYERVDGNSPGFFLYKKTINDGDELLFWSNQKALPPADIHALTDGEYARKLNNGYYLCIKRKIEADIKADSLIAFAIIPVQYDYFVQTDYLPNHFAYSSTASKKIAIAEMPTAYPVKAADGSVLFFLEPKAYSGIGEGGNLEAWMKVLAVFFLLAFFHFIADRVSKEKGAWTGIGLLAALLISLRVLSYFTSFPVNLRLFDLFDPSVYGSNPVQKSLGDLLINASFFCWLTVFAWSKLTGGSHLFALPYKKKNFIWGCLLSSALLAFTFIMAKTTRSLAADSDISFDVVNFFSLNRFSIFGFTALSILAIGYYYLTRILIQLISSFLGSAFYLAYFLIAVTGLGYLTIRVGHPLLNFYLVVIAWLIVYVRIMRLGGYAINRPRLSLASSLFWIFLFSVSITAIIISANREKEWELRKRLADKIDVQSDPFNERQLNISFTYLDDDFLAGNFHRFTSAESARQLRDSILRESGYLNKYKSRLYVFDADGKELFNEEAESLNTLNTVVSVQGKETSTPHLYYYETTFDKFTFILKREIRSIAGKLLGTLFIVSNPEQYSSDALYPELFRQANQNNPEESPVYSYGIYKKGILLVGPFNKYSFATSISEKDIPVNQYEKRVNGNFNELWYKASRDKVVVITKKRDTVIEAITLFSYIFCSFLFLVAIFNLLAFIFRVGGDFKEMGRLLQWNIRTQVHSTIILISIFSFFIIGIATISFFIQRYEQNNREKLSRTMQIMVNEMEKKLGQRKIFDDQLPIYDSVSNQDVQKLLNEVAEIHNVDVNVYDTSGNLQVSSQPIIYREGFLSKKIHPVAFYHLNRLRQVQYVQQEKLATISYLSIYAPIRDEYGHAYAYLNIPYFLSQRELKQEISNFLVTIINLNAFIFLIAGVIALFITNRVTRSFSLISEKMKEVNLGKTNEEIVWKRDDEIGGLVKEYNKMVSKLGDSAAALARSEREGAWREMARQVAHEIKNPLTPMKLSIQYLQKSIDNNTGNVKELTANVAKTLVEQIDHLSKIAFDFSQFANIGNTSPERFDLKEVLYSLGELYRVNDRVEIGFGELPEAIPLYTDKTQMNRLFTNLFQNAVEACAGKDRCSIFIDAVKENGLVRISVKDNGEGIPEEMQSKIFAPNFTTKSSGTGLGLAMCKGIVEQAKGKIWFETKKGAGTVFITELPLAT